MSFKFKPLSFLKKKKFMLCACIAIYAAFGCGHVWADDKIVTFYGKHGKESCSFTVELAVTPEEQARGLMFRKSLASDAGMLFISHNEEVRYFWMKNTFIPLDIVFINAKREVASIHYNAKPHDETGLTSKVPVKYVLEVNAGKAAQCKIKKGSKVRFKNISP